MSHRLCARDRSGRSAVWGRSTVQIAAMVLVKYRLPVVNLDAASNMLLLIMPGWQTVSTMSSYLLVLVVRRTVEVNMIHVQLSPIVQGSIMMYQYGRGIKLSQASDHLKYKTITGV